MRVCADKRGVARGANPDIIVGVVIEEHELFNMLQIYVLGDLTVDVKSPRASLDLDSVHSVVEVDLVLIVLDNDLLSVDSIQNTAKIQNAVVALNHKLGDFSEGLKLQMSARVLQDQRRVRWVYLCHKGVFIWAVT